MVTYLLYRFKNPLKTMKCFKCKRKANLELGHIPGMLCNSCFLKLIEKRVRKQIRINKLFSKNDNVLLLNDGTKEFYVTQILLENILKHLSLNTFFLKINDRFNLNQKKINAIVKKAKINKVIIPWNLDNEVEQNLEMMFTRVKHEKSYIKLLRNVSEKEIEAFACIRNLKYKKSKPFNQEINEMLSKLEKDHPDIKFSMRKSFNVLFE